MSGHEILPLVLDPRYAIDIDSERDLQRAEWMIRQGDLPFIRPGPEPRPIPPEVQILLLDFDGVLTDNRVWVNGTGDEWVAANRGDGWGIARLKEKGVQIAVLSTETNPVVSSRCRKIGVECFQGLEDKASAVEALLAERSIKPENAIFIGNDENDISAFSKVACALVVQDAHPSALAKADIILKHKGGYGAVREVCDMLIPQAEAD
jgi:N-acylneuraminate cytidylyltransferase